MTTIKDLLFRGYFPRELPPPFHTESFANLIESSPANIPNQFHNLKILAKTADHSIAKVGLARRRVSVPNPIYHYRLCKSISDNWPFIYQKVTLSTISRSTPTIGPNKGRAILPKLKHSELAFERSKIRSTSSYILKTDISKFYHTIYTHSIPWALYGKTFSKSNKKTKNVGNELDKISQNSQDGQTIGIPIGPDTSLIIAEIILNSFDVELATRIPTINAMRHVDDFEIGCTSINEGYEILHQMRDILREYELELNMEKTSIQKLPMPLDSLWACDLREFNFRATKKGQKSDLLRYFSQSQRHYKDFPNDHVLKYAIERLRSVPPDPDNWDFIMEFLFNSMIIETNTTVSAIRTLVRWHATGLPINHHLATKVLNNQIAHQCIAGHTNEVAWSIWAMIYWGLNINKATAEILSKSTDPFVVLIALDANSRGLIPNGIDTSSWVSFMTKDELYGRKWILSYEANVKGWLLPQNNIDHVNLDPCFTYLKNNGVEFYNPNRVDSAIPTTAATGSGFAPVFSFP